MKKRCLDSFLRVIFCVTFFSFCLLAKERPSLNNRLLTFERIPSANFAIINCAIRDQRGFLWFGTTKGLYKYDGYQVRVLPVRNELPLNGNIVGHDRQVIYAMIRMGDSALVLGTDLGLWNFNLRSEEFTPYMIDQVLSVQTITSIIQDSGNGMWIGTALNGLNYFDYKNKTLRQVTMQNGLAANDVTCLYKDHSGNLWIGTVSGGLHLLDPAGHITNHYSKSASESKSLSSNHIMSLCEHDDKLWIGTEDGVNVLDRRTDRIQRIDLHSPSKHSIPSVVSDPSGRIWIAVAELGLFFYTDSQLTQFTTPSDPERSLQSIKNLYIDPVSADEVNVLLWIGTRNGVDKVLTSRNPFHNFIRNQDSLELNRGAVLTMAEDHTNTLWVGLWGGGINGLRRAGEKYRRVANFMNNPTQLLSLPGNDVNSIMEDRNGNLWVGTNDGLGMIDRSRHTIIADKHHNEDTSSLSSNAINKIYEDHNGTIWVCTKKGLSRLLPTLTKNTGHRFKNFLNDEKDARPFGGNVVSDILEDRSGNLWVATYGRGLNRLNADGSFTRFLDPADSAMNQQNFVYSIIQNSDKSFWLSTRFGLVLFDSQTGIYTRYPIDHLNNAHIFDILPDGNGDLWLSTSMGLAKFNPTTNVFTRLGSERGLQFGECFSGFFQSRHQTLLLGGIDGFAEFSLADLTTNSRIPEIAITSFKVLDKEFSAAGTSSGKITLPYDQNFLSFSFAALDYADPLRNTFAYRMNGIDHEWIYTGTRNFAGYENLAPGSYLFMVKGCTSNNVWNEKGTSLSITITPPYWQTWWFRVFIAGCIGGIAYAAYRYRLRKLLEVERLRLRIADDLHDDVGSNLSAIAMVSRVVQRAPELSPATKEKLGEIYDTAVTTSEGMKDIVWFIKPRGDVLDDLLLRMKETASSLLRDIHYTFQAPENEGVSKISIDFKKNFFLAFKEILNNIVKHSGASEVEIRIIQKDPVLEMLVNDNGRGFDEHTIRQGHGLGSLHNRAGNLHGTCEIVSRPGAGTTIRFSGKLTG